MTQLGDITTQGVVLSLVSGLFISVLGNQITKWLGDRPFWRVVGNSLLFALPICSFYISALLLANGRTVLGVMSIIGGVGTIIFGVGTIIDGNTFMGLGIVLLASAMIGLAIGLLGGVFSNVAIAAMIGGVGAMITGVGYAIDGYTFMGLGGLIGGVASLLLGVAWLQLTEDASNEIVVRGAGIAGLVVGVVMMIVSASVIPRFRRSPSNSPH